MNERFIAANDLLWDSFQLAADIFEDGFRPDFLVGLWRGGSAVGIAVQEGLDYFGVPTDHIALRTSYSGAPRYEQMVSSADSIRVHGMRYLHEKLCGHHSMLIVDDVYSTGSSVRAVIDQLAKKTRRNMPQDIRIATVWYRPTRNTLQTPDYYVHEIVEIISAVPGMGLLFDTANALHIGEHPLKAAADAAPYTMGTHFKDHYMVRVAKPNLHYEISGCALGDGDAVLADAYRVITANSPYSDRLIMLLELFKAKDQPAMECWNRSIASSTSASARSCAQASPRAV